MKRLLMTCLVAMLVALASSAWAAGSRTKWISGHSLTPAKAHAAILKTVGTVRGGWKIDLYPQRAKVTAAIRKDLGPIRPGQKTIKTGYIFWAGSNRRVDKGWEKKFPRLYRVVQGFVDIKQRVAIIPDPGIE